MNMKSNIPKHPCANKCPNFKDEQCNTCLVPENAQNAVTETVNQKFIKGDVIVYISHIKFDDLEVVEDYQPNDHYWLECGQCVHQSWIRPATVAEIQANRRLTEAEQALAEVS